jgi:1-acyl-sn-glycerol-3-phosphate acyltransferase
MHASFFLLPTAHCPLPTLFLLATGYWLLATLPLILLAVYASLPWLVPVLVRVLLATRYRFKVRGLEHLPRTGPVLLAVNHVGWLDGFLLVAVCPRRGRALVNADYVNLPIIRSITLRAGMIPVPASGPHAHRAAIRAVCEALDRGEAVGIFPEAQLSRNGLLGAFYRGIEVIMKGRDSTPVVPVYLDNVWGSIYSFSGGSFLRKPTEHLGRRRCVGVAFGPPVAPPISVFAVRQAVLEAGVRAFELREGPARQLETLDPGLPRLEHPTLGLLAASTLDFERDGIRQIGQKPGTRGHPVPGVAVRAVDETGGAVLAEIEGRLQALVAGHPDWVETGVRGSVDRDGFVRVSSDR